MRQEILRLIFDLQFAHARTQMESLSAALFSTLSVVLILYGVVLQLSGRLHFVFFPILFNVFDFILCPFF